MPKNTFPLRIHQSERDRGRRLGDHGPLAPLAARFFVNTIYPMITFDEAKRQANLAKHGLDLADAALVYDAPNKVTLASTRNDEPRLVDVAMVEVMGVVLVLVCVLREGAVRAISLRRASKTERRIYESAQQD